MKDSKKQSSELPSPVNCEKLDEYSVIRIDDLRGISDAIATMISMLEMYKSKSLGDVLNEYRFSTDHLLSFVVNQDSKDELDKAEEHIRYAYKIASKSLILELYNRFEDNYLRLLRFSRKTGVGRTALHRMQVSMDRVEIKKRLSELYKVGDFVEYLEKAESVQKDFFDLSKQLSDAISECEVYVHNKSRNLVFQIIIIILGCILGIVSALLASW